MAQQCNFASEITLGNILKLISGICYLHLYDLEKAIMVLGIITSIAACPAIVGTTEAVRQGQSQNKREQHRGRKSNLLVTCSDPSRKARDIHGGTVILRNNKVSTYASPIASIETYFNL
jgi:hypothetical protein